MKKLMIVICLLIGAAESQARFTHDEYLKVYSDAKPILFENEASSHSGCVKGILEKVLKHSSANPIEVVSSPSSNFSRSRNSYSNTYSYQTKLGDSVSEGQITIDFIHLVRSGRTLSYRCSFSPLCLPARAIEIGAEEETRNYGISQKVIYSYAHPCSPKSYVEVDGSSAVVTPEGVQ